MANSIFEATGLLMLNKVTPVIKAFFGCFNLDENYPDNGKFYIAESSETASPVWNDIMNSVSDLVHDLGLTIQDEREDIMQNLLQALVVHFGLEGDEVLENFIENSDFNSDSNANVHDLFWLCCRFNDGHDLQAIEWEGCWHCDKLKLNEFGGYGLYASRNLDIESNSPGFLDSARSIDSAIAAGDLDKASIFVKKIMDTLIESISDKNARNAIAEKIGYVLA
ncbi:MAG: hypothetical protein KGI54_12310 [Pseudomonadota bacterium]|nr:hypothetical protein [Pseudomonadota bacterium]